MSQPTAPETPEHEQKGSTSEELFDTTEAPAFPDFHRKLADPNGFAWLAFGAALVLYGLTILNAKQIGLAIAALPAVLGLGGLLLVIATIVEYLSGRTFPCTMFGVYAAFFNGFVVTHVSWFGITGSYDGTTPNLYAPGAPGASQLPSVQGLWLSTFVILTAIFILAATRQSGTVLAFLVSLELYFILHMVDYFRTGGVIPPSPLGKSAGAFALLSGLIAWYNAVASLLTPESAFFTLPTFELIKQQ